ncbi:MAG: aminopeptidase [Mogibacterium sp.]|nr:aminopeptidase [Mogibacterium sp.]
MAELDKLIRDYAELVIRSGVNLQKGQRLSITCPVECADFARLCAAAAYEAGCREVLMRWRDDDLTRMKYLHADDDIFDIVNSWEIDYLNTLSGEGAAFLTIHAEDPESLKGVDPDRLRRSQISSGKALETYRARLMKSECPWCVCSVPSKAWAAAVFPELSEEEAVARLWKEILTACRVDGGDAVQNWRDHVNEVRGHMEFLNKCNFRTLRYKNAAGTDVTVDLPEGHYWGGAEEKAGTGVMFSPNIPTEEVFTLPKKDSMNGTLVATKPLSYNGSVIEGFSFKVKDGRIVEVHADKGEDILKDAVSVDEGASYFGEVALVAYDSPISRSGVLFLNTLFDENASCHFAFGEAYPNIIGAEDMSEEELLARGMNTSITHVDFMIGSEDLEITGITHDGREIPVFRNGNFAF